VAEVGLSKLALFPEKIKSVLRVDADAVDELYPVVVELSLTNACNLKCIWCSDEDLRASAPGRLTKETLFDLFADFKEGGVHGITIEGGGEPTVHGDFEEIVRGAVDAGLHVGLITNGVSKKMVSVAHLFDWIRVSVDATTSKEFEMGKGVNVFPKVIANIEEITKLCEVVGVGFVVTRYNHSRAIEFTKKMRDIGVDYVQYRGVVDHEELSPDKENPLPSKELLALKTDKFDVMVWGMERNKIVGNSGLPCRTHSLSTVVCANGDVYLCGRLNMDDGLPPIGNVNEQSFREIWFGDERTRQSGIVCDSSFCLKKCPACRITKFNEFIDAAVSAKTKHFL
jgi:MoaA/NifB/PqqE/SkfB family radical SAM enzyme